MTAVALLHLCLMSCVSMTPLKGKLHTSGSGAHGGYIYILTGLVGVNLFCPVIFSVTVLSFPSPPLPALAFVSAFPLLGKLFKPIVKSGSFSIGV